MNKESRLATTKSPSYSVVAEQVDEFEAWKLSHSQEVVQALRIIYSELLSRVENREDLRVRFALSGIPVDSGRPTRPSIWRSVGGAGASFHRTAVLSKETKCSSDFCNIDTVFSIVSIRCICLRHEAL
jgi:hypothetical protein